MPPVELTLAPVTSSVAAARGFLTRTLEEWSRSDPAWESVEWPAVQALSELATNAVLHAATEFTVVLDQDAGALRMEVRDRSPRALHQHRYGLQATTGRGLALVGTLSRDWGVAVGADGGKVVWCLVAPADGDGALDLADFLSDEERAELEAL